MGCNGPHCHRHVLVVVVYVVMEGLVTNRVFKDRSTGSTEPLGESTKPASRINAGSHQRKPTRNILGGDETGNGGIRLS